MAESFEEDLYDCKVCQSSFSRYAKFERHMASHTVGETILYSETFPNGRPIIGKAARQKTEHKCSICNKKYYHMGHYKKHLLKNHGIEEQSPVVHSSIQTEFHPPNNDEYDVMNEETINSLPSITNNSIDETVGTQSALQHFGESRERKRRKVMSGKGKSKKEKHDKGGYECIHCGKKFTQYSSMKAHKRTHTGERPYKCQECPKSFTYYQCLWNHSWSHKTRKSFSCDKCPKTFLYYQGLWNHNKRHKSKKHVRDVCSDSFNTLNHLNDDINKHPDDYLQKEIKSEAKSSSSEYPFKCELCSKNFKFQVSLTSHIRRFHLCKEPQLSFSMCKEISKDLSQMENTTAPSQMENGVHNMNEGSLQLSHSMCQEQTKDLSQTENTTSPFKIKKRSRGRPRKYSDYDMNLQLSPAVNDKVEGVQMETTAGPLQIEKRGPGRPRKDSDNVVKLKYHFMEIDKVESVQMENSAEPLPVKKRGPGRPKKRGPGRPRKHINEAVKPQLSVPVNEKGECLQMENTSGVLQTKRGTGMPRRHIHKDVEPKTDEVKSVEMESSVESSKKRIAFISSGNCSNEVKPLVYYVLNAKGEWSKIESTALPLHLRKRIHERSGKNCKNGKGKYRQMENTTEDVEKQKKRRGRPRKHFKPEEITNKNANTSLRESSSNVKNDSCSECKRFTSCVCYDKVKVNEQVCIKPDLDKRNTIYINENVVTTENTINEIHSQSTSQQSPERIFCDNVEELEGESCDEWITDIKEEIDPLICNYLKTENGGTENHFQSTSFQSTGIISGENMEVLEDKTPGEEWVVDIKEENDPFLCDEKINDNSQNSVDSSCMSGLLIPANLQQEDSQITSATEQDQGDSFEDMPRKRPRWKCTLCRTIFVSFEDYEAHVAMFTCTCGQDFQCTNSFSSHSASCQGHSGSSSPSDKTVNQNCKDSVTCPVSKGKTMVLVYI